MKGGEFDSGTYRYKSGDVYTGSFRGVLPHGVGEMAYASGDRYEGNFERGRRHGMGTYTYKSGKMGVTWRERGKALASLQMRRESLRVISMMERCQVWKENIWST